MSTNHSILTILSSTSGDNSASNKLAGECAVHLSIPGTTFAIRNLSQQIPLLTESSTSQLGVPAADRTGSAVEDLAFADTLIAELLACDTLIIAAPIYNFGAPANLKAWADLVAQQNVTFAYDNAGGLSGLVADRPTYLVVASGGTLIEGPEDLGTPWLRQFLGFLGITSVSVIGANGLAIDPDAGLSEARAQIAQL